jgi:hypothetical protein
MGRTKFAASLSGLVRTTAILCTSGCRCNRKGAQVCKKRQLKRKCVYA